MNIKRFIFNKLQNEISEPEIVFILGARQVGKTTLLRELDSQAQGQGLKTAFFDLEQPEVLARFNASDTELITMLVSAGDVLFIDEFQYIQNASKIFKAIYDQQRKIKIFCSGSSALEMHAHVKEGLAGRRIRIYVYPLSFAEWFSVGTEYTFAMYMAHGGMPGLVHAGTEEKKQQILTELLSSYVMKDVRTLIREEHLRAFNHLLFLLAENQGAVISMQSLAREIQMSAPTVERYITILEATYVAHRVYSYATNLGNELKKSCKVYLYDIGIRNALLKDFSWSMHRPDRGAMHETYVFLELKRMSAPNIDIRFWRTKKGAEVDFIVLRDREPIPFEVKSALSEDAHIPDGLTKFIHKYPHTRKAYVVNADTEACEQYEKCAVQFITFETLAKWGTII